MELTIEHPAPATPNATELTDILAGAEGRLETALRGLAAFRVVAVPAMLRRDIPETELLVMAFDGVVSKLEAVAEDLNTVIITISKPAE